MGINIWTNADGGHPNEGNWAGNWSGARVPTDTDVAYFTNVGGGGSEANCTFSGAISCAGVNVTSDYGGDVDFAGFAITTTGYHINAGSGTVARGASVFRCGGNWDDKDQATVTKTSWSAHAIIMTGAGTTFRGRSTASIYGPIQISAANITQTADSDAISILGNNVIGSLIVDEGASFLTSKTITCSRPCWISGTLTMAAGDTLLMNHSLTINATGVLTGAGNLRQRVGTITPTGTLSTGLIWIERDIVLGAGTYGDAASTILCEGSSGSRTLTIGGEIVFKGDVTFDADVAGETYTIDNTGNAGDGYDIEFQGAVTALESGEAATIACLPGATAVIKFGGAGTSHVDLALLGDSIGHIELDKGGGAAVIFTSDVVCSSFEGTAGWLSTSADVTIETIAGGNFTVGPNVSVSPLWNAGCALVIAGDLSLSGEPGNLLTFDPDGAWTIDVNGSATATYVDVKNCDANGGTEIDASDGTCVDSGSNLHWLFPLLMPYLIARHRRRSRGALRHRRSTRVAANRRWVHGPYRSAAGEVFHTGSVAGEVFNTGSVAGEVDGGSN